MHLCLCPKSNTIERAKGIAVSGDYAYVANRDSKSGLRIIDISNPSAPVEVGALDISYEHAVAGSGNTVVTLGYSSVTVIDVSDPAAPVKLDVLFIEFSGFSLDITISGDYAYVGSDGSGLTVIDISNRSSPTVVGTYQTPGHAHGVAVAGNYAYVANDNSGLRVFDISNPTSPTVVSTYDNTCCAYDVAVSGSYAYLAGGDFQIIDISNPALPSEVGSYNAPFSTDLALSGPYAYLVDYDDGLDIVSIANPSAPVTVSSIDTPGSPKDVAISGVYAYVADGAAGLSIVDISNPSAPLYVATYPTLSHANSIFNSGNYAYVGGRQIFDISNPTIPIEVGVSDPSGSSYDVTVSGNYAYAADLSRLNAIDVSDPTNPIKVGQYTPPDFAYGVAASGGYVYSTDRYTGLSIHRECQTTIPNADLTVSKTGTGTGTITSDPPGIDCGTDCAETFNSDTTVTLSAAADSDSIFAGWSGACSGTSATCTVAMTSNQSVGASFLSQITTCVVGDVTLGPLTYFDGDIIGEQAEGYLDTKDDVILLSGAMVIYEATTSIELNPGFHTHTGSVFAATVRPITCAGP